MVHKPTTPQFLFPVTASDVPPPPVHILPTEVYPIFCQAGVSIRPLYARLHFCLRHKRYQWCTQLCLFPPSTRFVYPTSSRTSTSGSVPYFPIFPSPQRVNVGRHKLEHCCGLFCQCFRSNILSIYLYKRQPTLYYQTQEPTRTKTLPVLTLQPPRFGLQANLHCDSDLPILLVTARPAVQMCRVLSCLVSP